MAGDDAITLTPIGYVQSSIGDRDAMPNDGVAAAIEVLPEYVAGLGDIESNTHIIILGWFHQANRHRLTVHGKSGRPGQVERGVLGLRSSTRPNPLGLNTARLVRREERLLYLERLDMIDGTPVVDIKRYSPGWDDVFAARTSRQSRPLPRMDTQLVDALFNEVEHFHGANGAGTRRAVRLIIDLCNRWGINPTDPELTVALPMHQGVAVDGEGADSFQCITRATFGSGRLRVSRGQEVQFQWRDRTLAAVPTSSEPPVDLEMLAKTPVSDLWKLNET